MITTAMAITRGAGTFNMVFDFAAASPAVDVLATDKWMLQIQSNKSSRIMKLNSVAGGAADQILLTPASDLVTIYLTEQEKNEIPDSGYAYILYKFNETTGVWDIQAYAAVTSTGAAPEEYYPEAVSFTNDDTDRTVTTDYSPTYDDNIIYTDPGVGETVVLSLPDLEFAPKKRFIIIPLSGDYDIETEDEGVVESGITTAKTIRRQSSTGDTIIY